MADSSRLLSICDPLHLVLIKTSPTGETTLVASKFLEWRTVLASHSNKMKISVELFGTGKVVINCFILKVWMFFEESIGLVNWPFLLSLLACIKVIHISPNSMHLPCIFYLYYAMSALVIETSIYSTKILTFTEWFCWNWDWIWDSWSSVTSNPFCSVVNKYAMPKSIACLFSLTAVRFLGCSRCSINSHSCT